MFLLVDIVLCRFENTRKHRKQCLGTFKMGREHFKPKLIQFWFTFQFVKNHLLFTGQKPVNSYQTCLKNTNKLYVKIKIKFIYFFPHFCYILCLGNSHAFFFNSGCTTLKSWKVAGSPPYIRLVFNMFFLLSELTSKQVSDSNSHLVNDLHRLIKKYQALGSIVRILLVSEQRKGKSKFPFPEGFPGEQGLPHSS